MVFARTIPSECPIIAPGPGDGAQPKFVGGWLVHNLRIGYVSSPGSGERISESWFLPTRRSGTSSKEDCGTNTRPWGKTIANTPVPPWNGWALRVQTFGAEGYSRLISSIC